MTQIELNSAIKTALSNKTKPTSGNVEQGQDMKALNCQARTPVTGWHLFLFSPLVFKSKSKYINK